MAQCPRSPGCQLRRHSARVAEEGTRRSRPASWHQSVIERACAEVGETDAALERTAAAIRVALAAALEPPLPKLGLELLDHTSTDAPLCAKIAGFSLHAARVVPAQDRDALEKLCRYGLRPPFSQERLSQRSDGRIVYRLRKPWPNAQGAHCLVFEPNDFLRRLAALVPAGGDEIELDARPVERALVDRITTSAIAADRVVEWEGTAYRVDLAAAEADRLAKVRGRDSRRDRTARLCQVSAAHADA